MPSAIFSAIQRGNRRYQNPQVEQWHATVASYNVHKCVGADGKFDPERVATVINELDADIIALQEADERFGRRAGLLDLRGLENTAKLVPVFQSDHAHSHGWHGNIILAREGLVSKVRSLKLPGVEPRGALIADLEIKGAKLRIIAAHLGLLRRSRAKQAETLLDAARADEGPTILMGDLNEWRVARRSSLMSLLPHFGPLDVALPSFPSRMPFLALDRILASPQQIISSIEVHDSLLARKASDHLPIKARIDLTPPVHLP
ncbi:diguanylate cyclase [Limoniibacter endophyticus]|uniref:Diguanylate cyclase n=1 Tax=Limoniibacter endophyticus TaxID=1565040 RepID=A0A8J3DKY0_9HYPH|nr:diguanylate cyclase [Limoniibacter endophyticus]